MKILVINCGSSSLKYQLRDMDKEMVVASGLVERIGQENGAITQKNTTKGEEQKFSETLPVVDHDAAMSLVADRLTNDEWGVIASLDEIDAVGHRIVQGGDVFQNPVLITEEVKETIRSFVPLAPLHNPAHLMGIDAAIKLLPEVPEVAVFDTEFHQTMPEKAFMYPLPKELYKEYRIRKYGFHGTSHKYVTRLAAQHLGKQVEEVNLITLHLGNGCSMAAVKNGKCVDTTMGMTPLAGLMMGSRSGDIDPAIISFLAENRGDSVADIDKMLNKESGLIGLCGMSDMRDIHAACEQGNEDAQLAFEMFAYRIKKTIGSYFAVLGDVDAIIFTAGIGENDDIARAAVCEGMERFGLTLDAEENATRKPGVREIQAGNSGVPILIVPTDEELEIAQATVKVVKA
ncbi:acetate kinase [Pseudodesulfovibrio sp. zrk46]|uniref:acetate kinase n=1 Tax=Pseudodesulfovibrio sp. zrk46 TaxID=2725288 RepID=UPI001448D72F|nr:acetate kinase [Pseudodesulfovibrio sp. zrk46]QJB57059.1 acetate kinase [Pseudodesulfovibrio sp. zrk46]